MKKRNYIIALLLLLCLNTYAYKSPIKFGKVSLDELQMTEYAPDTSAVAVVLCKYGYFNGTNYNFTETRRVKILKKAGTEYSEFTFPGNEKSNIRARVYNLVNGEIVEEKVKRESIFKEKVTEDYYRIRVAIPNVQVGTVYDIEVTRPWLPSEFAFQEDIPIKHSELMLESSTYIDFRKRQVGFLPLTDDKKGKYICKEVPAFKKEPYMSSAENYKTKFEFDILNIFAPGYYKEYTTSWDAVNDRLASNIYFGHAIFNGGSYLNTIKKEIEATCTTTLEKVEAAHKAIKKVKWNEYESVFTSTKSLSTAYKDGKANSADINLMLMQLLIKLDIHALPVVLSTRENGALHMFYPSFDKLNYVVIWTKIDGKEYLIDATDELLPTGLLPKRCLNKRGRLVTNERGKWIDLNTDKKDKQNIMYDLTLDEDLNLQGSINYARYDYAAYNFRKNFKEFASDDDFLTSLETKYPGLTIKDFNIDNINDLKQPIKDNYQIKISNQVERINDMLLINPFLFEQLEDNPFKLENRQFPVDFAYQQMTLMVSKITFPEKYQLESLPKPIKMVLPDKKTTAIINYSAIGNCVNVTYRIQFNKSEYPPEEYAYLQALYNEIIKKHAEPIVIKLAKNEASL